MINFLTPFNMKRLFSALLSLVLLFSASVPVHAKSKQSFDDRGRGLQNLVALVSEVQPDDDFLLIRRGGPQRRVNTAKAVIVKITNEGARVVDLKDLTVGAKARFLVEKRSGPKAEFNALLIFQIVLSRDRDEDDEDDEDDE